MMGLGLAMSILVVGEMLLFMLMLIDTILTAWGRRTEDRPKWVRVAEWMVPVMFSGHVLEWMYRSYRRVALGIETNDPLLFGIDIYLGLGMIGLWITIRMARHQVIKMQRQRDELAAAIEQLRLDRVKQSSDQNSMAMDQATLHVEQAALSVGEAALTVEKAALTMERAAFTAKEVEHG